MKLLVVEKDKQDADTLAENLMDQNYLVDVVCDGRQAWEFLDAFTYDLVLLDVILSEVDGPTLCRRLRSHGCGTPILMLAEWATTSDKVVGLDAGADDYLIKPVEQVELDARIRALSRRGKGIASPLLESEGLQLDPHICEVTYKGQRLCLSAREYRLLELFMCNKHRVFSCSQLIERLWVNEETTKITVRTHISSLRKKLKVAGASTDLIETVYGSGYRLKQKPK